MARPSRRKVVALRPLENDPRELDGARERECVARQHLQREPPASCLDVGLGELARPLEGIRRPVRDRHEQRSCRCHEVVRRFGVVAQNAGISRRATEDSNL
jgi:hypothetical protein